MLLQVSLLGQWLLWMVLICRQLFSLQFLVKNERESQTPSNCDSCVSDKRWFSLVCVLFQHSICISRRLQVHLQLVDLSNSLHWFHVPEGALNSWCQENGNFHGYFMVLCTNYSVYRIVELFVYIFQQIYSYTGWKSHMCRSEILSYRQFSVGPNSVYCTLLLYGESTGSVSKIQSGIIIREDSLLREIRTFLQFGFFLVVASS